MCYTVFLLLIFTTMYTKESFWKSVQNEIRIIKHLATKVPAGKFDYKPSEAQRSMLELMQYLSAAGSSMLKALTTEDAKAAMTYTDFRASVTPENFAEKMDMQEKDMKEMFLTLTDEDFKKEFDYYGVRTKAEHLVDGILKNFAAYRMQFFLYIKACGAHVSTMDVWRGVDTPVK